jgi:hypothetical protein
MGLKLYVYNFNESYDEYDAFGFPSSLMSIEAYLHAPPHWKADLYEMILMFDELPMSINEDINNFGVLHNILPQLQEMMDRLTQNKFALLRTVGEHTACFFIFERVHTKVLFSSYNKLPDEYLSYFPLKNSPMFFMDGRNQRKLLYDFVENDKRHNYPNNTQHTIFENIKNFELDYLGLIESLKKQIDFGNKLLEN